MLEILHVDRAHILGSSLGSAIAQELALAAPNRVASLVLYCARVRTDGFMRAMMSWPAHPWRAGDLEAALMAADLLRRSSLP